MSRQYSLLPQAAMDKFRVQAASHGLLLRPRIFEEAPVREPPLGQEEFSSPGSSSAEDYSDLQPFYLRLQAGTNGVLQLFKAASPHLHTFANFHGTGCLG